MDSQGWLDSIPNRLFPVKFPVKKPAFKKLTHTHTHTHTHEAMQEQATSVGGDFTKVFAIYNFDQLLNRRVRKTCFGSLSPWVRSE